MEHEQTSTSTDAVEPTIDANAPTGAMPTGSDERSLDQVAADHAEAGASQEAPGASTAPMAPAEPAPAIKQPPAPGAGARGLLTATLGLAGLAGAAALALDKSGLAAQVATHGVTPAIAGGFGLLACIAAAVQRRMERLAGAIRTQTTAHVQQVDQLRSDLSHLLDANRPPATGEELQYVVLSLQRHDAHAANLLRGMKLQAKAVADIGDHVAQIQTTLKRVESMFESLAGESRMIRERLVQTTTRRDLEEQKELLLGVEAHLQELAALPGSLQKLGERTATASELDRQSQLTRTLVGEKAQATEKLLGEDLARRIDTRITELQSALAKQGQDGGIDRLERCVREMQREVGSLAQRIGQTTPAAGVRDHAAMPQAPAAVVETGSVLGMPPQAPAANDDAAAGVAQNAVGTRPAQSKNVLSAIARLKQMKT